MANVTLVFKKTAAKIGSVELDASISETHQSEVELTEHPVERGTNIVDHARPKPDALTMECLVTNTPMPTGPLVERTSTRDGKTVAFQSYSGGSVDTRAGQAYKDLLDLKDAAQLITVVTGLRTYENMMIKSLSVPRDVKTSQSLRFSVSLLEVRVVSTKRAIIEQKKVGLGKKAAAETPAAQRKKTTLLQVKNKAVEGLDYIKGMISQ